MATIQNYDQVTAAMSRTKNVRQRATIFANDVADRILAAKTDTPALEALAASLKANGDKFAGAMVADTPAA